MHPETQVASTARTDGPTVERFTTRIVRSFERVIVLCLIVMLMVVVGLSTLDLAWMIAADIVTPPFALFEANELLTVFGFFLLILIGVELLETVKSYLRDHVVRMDIVVEVALIAIARKVIVVDPKEYGGLVLIGIAALTLALALALFAPAVRRLLERHRPAPSA